MPNIIISESAHMRLGELAAMQGASSIEEMLEVVVSQSYTAFFEPAIEQVTAGTDDAVQNGWLVVNPDTLTPTGEVTKEGWPFQD